MKKYKVEITKTYCINIERDTEPYNYDKLQGEADNILDEMMFKGTEHYNQIGDTEYNVYDVTDTDEFFYKHN